MKCPWCRRDIGFPSTERNSQCPYCAGKVTLAFRGKKILKLTVPVAVIGWLLAPYLGGATLVLGIIAVVLPAMYVEKRF